jgi:penicillin-binding protein 1A
MSGGVRSRGRRKPKGDDRARLDVRLSAADRPGTGTSAESPARPRAKSPPRGKPARSRRRSAFGRIAYWGLVCVLWCVIGAAAGVAWVGAHLPPIQSLEVPKRPPSIRITGYDGRLLTTRGDSGVSATLADLPAHAPQAFLAIEDRRFLSHYGVDPMGILRAASANILRRGVSQGGSTITQQLAKNLFLTQDRTLTRKLQEVVLALWLERKFTKTQILELYLNRVYFGAGAYGIAAAAERYFDKPANKLSIAEAAMLAGLVKAPSRLAPTRNPDGARERAQVVLAAMVDAGYISDKQAQQAIAKPAQALKQNSSGSVNYIADWIMDLINDLVGRVDDDIVVETSIDPQLQAAAEQAVVDELNARGEKNNVGQGALVAMTPDGAVRALVGGRSYAESQFNRAVSAKRQPGSAFKPFVYLAALERGLTPDTVREDKPIALKGWKPENYTHEYFGQVTLTQALAMSLNTVSVRLTLELGPQAVTRTAHRLGIASKLDPNPSIALGTSEVSVMELVSAFAPFSNGGYAVVPHVVQSVRRGDGRLLYQRRPESLGQVVEPRMVGMMNAMMRETLTFGTGRKAEIGYPAAGKTGTSQDFRDAWFVGYTSQLVTGVWLGNDDGSPTKKVTGGGMPSEIWARVMKSAHRGTPVAALPGTANRGWFGTAGASVDERLPPPLAVAERGQPAPARQSGIDTWLIDRLFGRR